MDLPGKLYLELTSRCNLDCPSCFRKGWFDPPRDMDARVFRTVRDWALSAPSVRSVVLGGLGEPTVAPIFPEAVASFPGRFLSVTTNGISLGDETVAALAENASLVVFSIDGTEAGFLEARGAPLSDALGSVRRLVAARGQRPSPRVEFQFTATARNLAELPAVAALAADCHCDALRVSHVVPQSEADAPLAAYARLSPPDTLAAFASARLVALRRGLELSLPNSELKTERRCAFAEDSAIVVTAEGEIVPCYRLSRDGEEWWFGRGKRVLRKSYGNAAAVSPADAWREWAPLRESLLSGRYPSCPDCDLVEGCDLARDTASDCWSGSPSCADCPWARGFSRCP